MPTAAPLYPAAALRASREEVASRPLLPIGAPLPPGLRGHYFVVSSCGSVDSNGAPYPDHNDRPTVINGDGMVWRFDLAPDGGGPPRVSSAIVKPPDYYADLATRDGSDLALFGFSDAGLLRASPFLGTRNFGNTAFVPLPAPGRPTRLVCCYDAGVPIEIDPATLATRGVVGSSWDPEALDGLVPFPPVLATAHPFFDPATGELFAVNYGRTGASMLETLPLLEALAFLPEVARDVVGRLAAALGRAPGGSRILAALGRGVRATSRAAPQLRHRTESALPQSFLDLVVWPGHGDIERFQLFDEATGEPAAVLESMHQVAATRRFVLLLDTNFKLRLDQTYDNPFVDVPDVERLVRMTLASQQGRVSNLWIVERAALAAARASGSRVVQAAKVPLPGAVHFLADFEDRDGIRLLCAHGNALDIAEWVRSTDLRLDGTRVREDIHGVPTSPVDVSQLGQYVIDPATKRVTSSQRLSDDALWGVALYAARGVPAWDAPPERLRHAFWFGSGLWPDTYTLFIRSLYADYPDRFVPLADVDRLVREGGRPSTLVCVDLEGFELCDRYTFPPGTTLSSPQFIPDPTRGDGDRDGFIAAIVWSASDVRLSVFDARDLARGPISEHLVPATLGFSLHSAWLPRVEPLPPGPAAPAPDVAWKTALAERLERLTARARRRLQPFLDRLG